MDVIFGKKSKKCSWNSSSGNEFFISVKIRSRPDKIKKKGKRKGKAKWASCKWMSKELDKKANPP
jgi:hypothetical protein